jgi:uncharacterized membrane protein
MSHPVRLYVKNDCPLCDEAGRLLHAARLDVREIDVDGSPVLRQLYGPHIPVADFGDDVRLYWPFGPDDVQAALRQAGASRPHVAGARTRRLVAAVDRAVYHFARHWALFIAFIVGLYAGLPLLGPVLMAAGLTRPANVIYTVYRLLCHQLPSRSSFIFGQQICYCDRCMGIYSTLFVAVLAFTLLRSRLKPLPWPVYIAFVVPMAVDGLTQILGLHNSNFELRLITGGLFGLGSAWLALPYLERGFRDVLDTLSRKPATTA